jgi:hypothetical protein
MASLSIAVETVDKRLDRLRAVVPKSHDEVVDLISQYHKAVEVLQHARKLAQPKDALQASKAIDHRLELIEREQQKLEEWQQDNNNGSLNNSSNLSNNNNLSSNLSSSNNLGNSANLGNSSNIAGNTKHMASPSKSPLKAVLTNRTGSRSSLQYQSWAGNLVYRRTPVTIPKMQRHIATHRSLHLSTKTLATSGLRFFQKRQVK